MIDYTIPYSFEIKEQDDGTFQITICAIGFKTPTHAEEFMKEFDGFDIVAPAKPKPMVRESLDDEAVEIAEREAFEDDIDELDEFLDDTPRDDKAKGGLADLLGV